MYCAVKSALAAQPRLRLKNFAAFRRFCVEKSDEKHLAAWAALCAAIELSGPVNILCDADATPTASPPIAAAAVAPSPATAAGAALFSAATAAEIARLQEEVLRAACTQLSAAAWLAARQWLSSGVLVVGAAGCGKSALLRRLAALAARGDGAFAVAELSSTALVAKEVGASERNLAALCRAARSRSAQTGRAVLLLLDDVDRLFPAALEAPEGRLRYPALARRLLDALLAQFELLRGSGVVLVATAASVAAVHPALCRGGRLEETLAFA